MKTSHTLLILVALFFSQSLFSQNGESITVRDFEAWGSVSLNYKFNKHWKFSLEEQLRLRNNASEIDAYFSQFSTRYDISKQLYAGFGFRYLKENDNTGAVEGYEANSRLNFDLGYTTDYPRLDVEYRLRYQTKNEVGITKEDGDIASKHLRFKTSVGYNIKNWKFDPEFSVEIFRHFEEGQVNDFNKFRMTLRTKYKMKEFGKIGLFYRMEIALNTAYPFTTNILGLKYSYTIKNRNK